MNSLPDKNVFGKKMKTQLDKWDFRLIKYFKSRPPITVDGIKEIWAERCGIEVEYIKAEYIVDHLLSLTWDLELVNKQKMRQLIIDAHPVNGWKFGLVRNQDDYWENWLAVLDSFLSLTEVKFLPGYQEFLKNEKNLKMFARNGRLGR